MTNPQIPERAFQAQVIHLAKLRGWRVAHFRTAINARGRHMTPVAADGAGWPDLFLVRGTRVIAAELKTERGRLSTRQQEWVAALLLAGIDTRVWRPSDWPEIENTLTSKEETREAETRSE